MRLIVFLSVCLYFSPALAGDEDVLYELRSSLERTVRMLAHVHVFASVRGSHARTDSAPQFFDIWLSGDHAQYRIASALTEEGANWWSASGVTSMAAPVLVVDPAAETGKFTCIRPSPGGIQFADLRPESDEFDRDLYSCLYTTNSTADRRLAFYLPLVDLNRGWSTQEGAWLIINHILASDLDDWTFVEMTELRGVRTARVDIKASKMRQEKLVGPNAELLVVSPVWRVWFSQEQGHGSFPLRIEKDMIYEFRGKSYPLIHSGLSKSSAIFEAFDITEFYDGLYYPKQGIETTYFPKNMKSANADEVAEQISRFGKFVSTQESVAHSSREWYVHALTQIMPTENLWIDPPKLAQVYDIATGSRSVVGVSEEESESRLTGAYLLGKNSRDLEFGNAGRGRNAFLLGNLLISFLLIAYFVWRRKRAGRKT